MSEINFLASASNEVIRSQFEKGKGSKTNVSMFMTKFDANKDGKLDDAELAKLKKVSAFIMADDFDCKKIDKDNDGIFSEKELEAFEKEQPKKTKEINILNNATTDVINKQFKENKDKETKIGKFLTAFDRNKDGKIDEDEVKDLKLASKYLKEDDDFDMKELDKNEDGKIDAKEMAVFRLASFVDKDKDGELSEEEAKEFKLSSQFDENADGILSDEELKNLNLAKNFDVNNDGVLSEEEFSNMQMAKVFDADNDGGMSQAEIANMQAANSMSQQMSQEVGVNGGCGVSSFDGALNALKAEPTIAQKFDTINAEVEKIEKEIKDVKEKANKAVVEKEQTIKNLEEELLKAKESDSEAVKNLKSGISEKSQEIIKQETDLRAKEVEVDSLTNMISADNIVLAGMRKEFAGLKTDTSNEKVNAKNQERKNQLEKQIADLESKIKANEDKLKETKKARDTLKNETIPKLKEERSKLEEDLAKADASYKDNIEKLKEARKTFEEAKTKIENERDKKVAELEKTLQTKRAEATQLSEKQGDIKGKSGQYGAAIDAIMSKNGVLAGNGHLIVQIADKYGIPADIFASIIASETGRGTSNAIRNYNNPGGVMTTKDGCRSIRRFASLEQGLEHMASLLKRKYFDEGRTTLATIQPKYCPVGAANDPRGLNKNWLPTTTKIQAEINRHLI